MLFKMKVTGITIDPTTNAPIIILKEEDGDQAIPIWIGLLEATAIATELEKIRFSRPMTHDLFKNFLDILDIKISKIEVCDLRENTYFARIHFIVGDRTFDMDARPSDAIALALRTESPIYVNEKVIIKSKQLDGQAEVMDKTREAQKWTEYLEKLSPEDFGKYKM
nr:bifunctional nuclease family protein [Desulfobacterales bacterium]